MHEELPTPSLGVEWIDAEHRLILRRVERLASVAAEGSPEELRGALRLLTASLEDHWRHEEEWMAEQGYTAAGDHGRQHALLLERLGEARAVAKAGGPAARAAADLAHALREHMRTEDLKLARFFAARENLRRLAGGTGGKGPALTPIPGATPVPAGAKPTRE